MGCYKSSIEHNADVKFTIGYHEVTSFLLIQKPWQVCKYKRKISHTPLIACVCLFCRSTIFAMDLSKRNLSCVNYYAVSPMIATLILK